MEIQRQDRPARRGFVLLVALLAVAAGAKAVMYDSLDPDLFWHLRVADALAAQRFPGPMVDQLSFASIKAPWTPYSWLADLAMKGVWDAGGWRAAVAIAALMSAALVVFLALIALESGYQYYGRPTYLAAAMAAFGGGFLSLPYLSFRPVTLALLIVAVCAWLLVRDRRLRRESRAVWLVIPLTALLTNIHLYAVFMPLLVAALLLERQNRGRHGILLAGTIGACLATPMLPGAIRTAWNYQFTDVMVSGHMIAEMQPFYQGTLGWAAALVALGIVVAAAGRRRAISGTSWIWLALGSILLLRLGRFAPVFAILAAPTLAVTLPRLSDQALGRRLAQGALAVMLLLSVVRVAAAFPSANTSMNAWINRAPPGKYPAAAAEFVQTNVAPRTHRIITEFTWGGFLEWKLGSNWQMLLDGRTQLFSSDFWRSLYLSDPRTLHDYLATVSADAAIVPSEHSRFRQSLLDLGWKTIYADPEAQVLAPPAPPAPTAAPVTSNRHSGQYIGAQDSASSETP